MAEYFQPFEKRGKYTYDCSEDECDIWAGLFDFDEKNIWRFKFAIDSVSLKLDDVQIVLGSRRDQSAWQEFVKKLKSPAAVDKAETQNIWIKCNGCGSKNLHENLFCSTCGQHLKAENGLVQLPKTLFDVRLQLSKIRRADLDHERIGTLQCGSGLAP